MQTKTDLYEILGVARDADRATIQKAYRALARETHPDLNPGDAAAEERFKAISRAWDVLGDEDKRRDYDEFGEMSLEPGFDAEEARRARDAFGAQFGDGFGGGFGPGGPGGPAGDFELGGIEDLLGNLFGGARGGRGFPGGAPEGVRLRGRDLEARLELDFLEAVRGGEKRMTVSRPRPDGGVDSETLTVRIPPGVDTGGRLRLAGKGAPGIGGGTPGDLHVKLTVRPHPVFRRDDRNLSLDLPITVSEAVLGAKVEVPTLDGRATLTIPPGTQGGARLRLRGKGVPTPGGAPGGDLLVRIQIRVPREVDEEAKAALEKLAELDDPELRKSLFS